MPLSEDEIRKVVKDELKRFQHNDLMDMPQQGHVNRDHDGRYHRKHANVYLDLGNYIYWGSPATNGSWRATVVSGGELEFQKLVDGTWTYYARFG